MPTTSELAARIRAKYPGAYDDIDDASLSAKVKARFPGAYDDYTDDAPSAQGVPAGVAPAAPAPGLAPPPTSHQPSPTTNEPTHPHERFARGAIDVLPTVGSFLGGGAGPLAGIGAAGGEAFRQLGQHAMNTGTQPQDSEQAMSRIGRAGQQGLVAAYTGAALVKGSGKVGAMLARSAVGRNVLNQVAKKFPTARVVDTIMRERVPIGRSLNPRHGGKTGADLLRERVAQSASRLDEILANADRSGATFNMNAILARVNAKIAAIAAKPAGQRQARVLTKLAREESQKYSGSIAASQLNLVKRQAQEIGYKTRPLDLTTSGVKQFNKLLADEIQASLESIPRHGAAIAQRNLRTQELMAAERAVRLAQDRGGAHLARLAVPLGAAGAGAAAGYFAPGGSSQRALAGAAAGAAVASPALRSSTALTLTNPILLELLRRGPSAAISP